MLRILLAALVACMALPAFAQTPGLAGAWEGEWIKDGDGVPVIMTFDRAGETWTGSFESDALQAAGIPLSAVREMSERVHFEVKGDFSTAVFDGVLAESVLSGAFTDAGATGSFRLTRMRRAPPAIRSRDVTFTDGSIILSGTLLLPNRPGPRPAILFLQGSGPEGRWANRWLAQHFAEAGFAALIYDKRGVGASSGDWRTASFDVLAQDGAAGVRFLRSQPEIDPGRVGAYGHSQGGSVVPLVDADVGGLGFIIAASAPGLKPADVETYSVGNAIGIDKLTTAERADARAYLSALIDVGYRGGSRATLDELAEHFKGRSWFFAPPPVGDPYWVLSRAIAGFDPAAAWRRVRAPVLLVYGEHDERVPPRASLDAIRDALRAGGDDRVAVKVYSDADHTFTMAAPARSGGWPRHEPDYASTLIAWVEGLR